MRFYRYVMSRLHSRWRRTPGFDQDSDNILAVTKVGNSTLAWFHVASVGEYEGIAPILKNWLERGGRAVVSVFSENSVPLVQLRVEALMEGHSRWKGRIQCGLSPLEGRWRAALERFRPQRVVTYKYDAWPDLWASVSELAIPLTVVSAGLRSSQRFIKRFFQWIRQPAPSLLFACVDESDARDMRRLWPGALVRVTGDPRWDQVLERAQIPVPRAEDILKRYAARPRPWGILAQVWQKDLQFVERAIAKGACAESAIGTLWIVPHDLSPGNVRQMEKWLSQHGSNRSVVFVPEFGVLNGLYPQMDWAYIGGGWGRGPHNTMEPAVWDLPICIGPRNSDHFAEIQFLKDSGQLVVAERPETFAEWLVNGPHRSPRPALEAIRTQGAGIQIADLLSQRMELDSSLEVLPKQ